MKRPLENSVNNEHHKNPIVFLDIVLDDEKVGRLIIELFKNVVPRTAENFRALCTGEKGIGVNGKKLHYKGSIFHKMVPNFMIQGGDIINFDGTSGESIHGQYFDDESFEISHSERGYLSAVNEGRPNTNSSQFIITTDPSTHLDNTNVAFGKVIRGMGVIDEIVQKCTSIKDKPQQTIKIIDCGEIKHDEDWGLIEPDGTSDLFPAWPEDWDYVIKLKNNTDKQQADHNYVEEVIEKIKQSGNYHYGKKKYPEADRKYSKALRYYNWIIQSGNISDNLNILLTDLRVSILLNQSAVYLKRHKYRDALNVCNKVLSIDENNSKALFRCSQAHVYLNDYDIGLAGLKKLYAANPNNKEILREIKKVETMMQNYLIMEKRTYQRMFQ
ncbi:hypothetical protein PV328_000278 [Microctonus aethiopoides]|uniref:peptidylprolyl isomerase n=1 Tax=Microctonus aethiopoides TaxID=144406 RepID=A0AA39KW94_9HYME|nr:hypothetical protein PV328_000278 [Microctonus aethiopoides]